MAANGTNGSIESEDLYHVKRTIIDLAQDKSGATRTTDVLGTFTSLAAAKLAANSALASEGYLKDDFATYEEKTDPENWKHDDHILVFAKAPAGQEFEVRIDVTTNPLNLKGNADGEVEGHLHYVLQTTIDYNDDRIGSKQVTLIEGTYLTRAAAYQAAKTALLDEDITEKEFAEYDLKESLEEKGEWPYGDDCLVHAVGQNGDNFLIHVKAQPHSHQHHACKHHAGKKCDCACKHGDTACKVKACKHADCDCK